ncbi:SNF2 family N-terminal domain-containing protein [Trichoderma sp. SZMC 28015]
MEPYDTTQHMHVQNLHTTLTAKRYLDLDEFDDSSHVASKRACLQPQYSLSESSLLSAGFQTYTIDPNVDIDSDLNIAPNFDLNIDPNFDINFSVETAEVTDISSFEDQMDTSGDATPCSTQEDIMSTSPGTCNINSTAANVPAIVEPSEPDTCFGLIVATATSSFKGHEGATNAPVTLEALETKVKLSSQDTQRYARIINNATLAKIFREFTIKADAKLVTPTNSRKKTSKKEVKSFRLPVDCPVRIVLYGLATDQYTIGNILGNAGFYFQHPLPSEYDSNMQYCNPHYLLRPGSQLPTLEEDSVTGCDRKVESDLLNASNKGRFMRLVDEASEIILRTSIEPSSRLKSTLKEHQISALAWLTEIEAGRIRDGSQSLWEPLSGPGPVNEYRHKITGNRKASPELAPGGVLADEMGLGKSLSMLALICSSLDIMETQKREGEEMRPRRSWTTLIVTPKSTIHNWQQQCESHINPGSIKIAVYLGSGRKKLQQDNFQNSDIILTTYETMRIDWEKKGYLFTSQWYRVVLDEAHHIRTRSSQTFRAACEIQACYRWCLTGTPIHNSLDDFAALLSFVGVPIFMKKNLFDFWITRPIKEKQSYGLRQLGLLIKGTCLRRTKKMIELSHPLPDRREKTTWVELTPRDRNLYSFFEKEAANIASGSYRHNNGHSNSNDRQNNNILKLINFLRLICDHGEQLLPQSAVEIWSAEGDKTVDWQSLQELQVACDMCGLKIDNTQGWSSNELDISYPRVICEACHTSTRENGPGIKFTNPDNSMPIPNGRESLCSAAKIRAAQQSPKLKALVDHLRQEQVLPSHCISNQPIKSVIFSSWAKMVDLTQQCLEANGFVCARIDGQLSLEGRSKAIKRFNLDLKCTVMLATIGSAAEGIDLTAANNVHLLEPHWNPMIEAQALDRVHRIGQSREVLVTKYVTKDTIETYVQWIQKEKLRLIQESLDSQDISQVDISDQRWKELRACLRCER